MNAPQPVAQKPRATYQDVLDAPEHMTAEIIRGVLHLQPRPRYRHARSGSRLGARLAGFDDDTLGPGGWIILDEPELHFGEDVLIPDLAGWRRERMPEMPDVAWTDLAPDWVCEVLSPSTRQRDRTDKQAIYGERGVAHLWFVDPDAQTLEAFALREAAWTLIAAHGGARDVRVSPFEALEWPLGALWAR